MHYRIEVALQSHLPDPVGREVVGDIEDLGITGVEEVRFVRVYVLVADFASTDLARVAKELLADPVTEEVRLEGRDPAFGEEGAHIVEVARKPGVMDAVEASALMAISDMGLVAEAVKTARKYIIRGELTEAQLELVSTKILANPSIEEWTLGKADTRRMFAGGTYEFKKVTVPIREAGDEELLRLSREGQLFLNLLEMQAIRDYYQSLGRDPIDVELESIAQTWSEHCVHKTFRGDINYQGRHIKNLLKSTIMKVTRELDKPWCVSVFEDNSGIIEFDENYNVCFKVETHNHPSAIEPYGGAGTGIGGVIRDPLGTGLGAKPVANTDVFCFGLPDMSHEEVPKGALHPKRVMKGVVAGVRDYGNRMGIPTVNGAVYFDERFVGNPLVYCGTVGLIPKDKSFKQPKQGDLVVVVGGRTGRDGIHGVTFASGELTESSEVVSGGAVQIGNPITEKKVVDVLLQARDRGFYSAITDCGGGGLSSAVGEMGQELGVEVHLERVPLKYEGLSYTEIWISEAQERMLLAVPPEKENELLALFASEDVEATVIGSFTGRKRLELFYQGQQVADLDMMFLHEGFPKPLREAVWEKPSHEEPELPEKADYGEDLKKILGSYNVCSKEWIVRQYDHEVQGGCILKPLVGQHNDGPGDATVMTPVLGSRKGIIIACGLNPKYSDIDPYAMAASAIDEAVRQVIAVGGTLKRLALLDNFSWGNTDKPDRLGGLVRASLACYDVAGAYGTPFISGKDSLNNEFRTETGTIAIPSCLLISALGIIDDVTTVISMDLKAPGNLIYLVGLTRDELGGSHYYHIHGAIGNRVPTVDVKLGRALYEKLSDAIQGGLVKSCHDLSEGGLAVAAAEMAFAGGLGLELELGKVPAEGALRDQVLLFSESNSRFLVEVTRQRAQEFEAGLRGVPFGQLGTTLEETILRLKGQDGENIIEEDIWELKEAWQAPLRW